MMVASVVEHEDDATASRSIAQQLREEALERCGIEHLTDSAHELTGAQIDRAKAGDGLAGGSMQQNRVFILRGAPTCDSASRVAESDIRPSSTAQRRRAGPGGGVFFSAAIFSGSA